MLLLDNANRFSVDIDVITEEGRETIESVLDKVIAASHFRGWKLDEKRSYKQGIPKRTMNSNTIRRSIKMRTISCWIFSLKKLITRLCKNGLCKVYSLIRPH